MTGPEFLITLARLAASNGTSAGVPNTATYNAVAAGAAAGYDNARHILDGQDLDTLAGVIEAGTLLAEFVAGDAAEYPTDTRSSPGYRLAQHAAYQNALELLREHYKAARKNALQSVA